MISILNAWITGEDVTLGASQLRGFLCDFVFALDVSKVDMRGKSEGNMWTFFIGNRSF
jgi:hypothetical protein